MAPLRIALVTVLLASASACAVGPNYHRPAVATPPTFKEADGWAPADPTDAADRKDWWTVFGDPTLDALETQAAASNQTLAGAEAAYRAAADLVKIDRAALFPTISLTGSATRSGGGNAVNSVNPSQGAGVGNGAYRVGVGGSWQPDLWGQVRRTIEGARASAQGSAATVANTRLSVQIELALDYIQLRQLDEEKRILDETARGYARSLAITQNRYAVGVAAKSDVLSAQSQLATTRAGDVDLVQQRARMEHAIAILAGKPPAALTLASAPWSLRLPDIPTALPSDVLQRRPDIATAERSVAAANAQIGVATAAWFPAVTLSASGDSAASSLARLFSASSNAWSLGASLAETLLDFGARPAKVAQARALHDQSVANYRQTVLTAFGQVEDNLAAQRVLADEGVFKNSAADAAAANETITRNQYLAGQADYTAVVIAQATALTARTAELQIEATRLTTAVDLIAALGGGWRAADIAPRR